MWSIALTGKSFGAFDVFSELNFSIARGTSIGFLAQTAEESTEHTVWQETAGTFTEASALAAQMCQLEQEMLDPARGGQALERYSEIEHEFKLSGGYQVDSRVRRMLNGPNFGSNYTRARDLSLEYQQAENDLAAWAELDEIA